VVVAFGACVAIGGVLGAVLGLVGGAVLRVMT
jgi:coenzyme F420-reducing hydrogenase gamma subunit